MNLDLTSEQRAPTDFPSADNLNRVVKIAIDSGDVDTVEAGYALLQSYRVGIFAGPELSHSVAHQAALLTAINIGRRSLLGGVYVLGNLEVPLRVPLPGYDSLAHAVIALGGSIVPSLAIELPVLAIGKAPEAAAQHEISLQLVFSDWRGGVLPASDYQHAGDSESLTPAAALAAAIGVSEVFQHLRGNPMAGRRSTGLSLWSPDCVDWLRAPAGPAHPVLPTKLWLIGLGHLGQAYLWVLGLLPYSNPAQLELVLQDFDLVAESNDSTSLLTDMSLVGMRKTRAMAHWCESRGFRTQLVERRFPGGISISDDEPRIAIGGVDNAQARAALEDAGFDWIVESGLGAGPIEYLAIRLHTFPASTSAKSKWGSSIGAAHASQINATPYQHLAQNGMNQCGLVQMASRTVGAPFVGTVAATMVVAEVMRVLNGGAANEVLDMSLRDPASRELVASTTDFHRLNPGYTR